MHIDKPSARQPAAPNRCAWCGDDPLYIKYHDEEWGKRISAECDWFEFLTLEGAQAGLSWITILRKRENYRTAFDNFDVQKIAHYGEAKVAELLQNEGIIRNRLKINSTIKNARAFIKVQKEYGSFNRYIWQISGMEKPLINNWKTMADLPAVTPTAERMSKQLKKDGFSFVGPTICYAFMQATGMVNDHVLDCVAR